MYCADTEIKLWHGKTGKTLGTVNTNQLKNSMATISPNGRFLAAAAFTADVKVSIHITWDTNFADDWICIWQEIIPSKYWFFIWTTKFKMDYKHSPDAVFPSYDVMGCEF